MPLFTFSGHPVLKLQSFDSFIVLGVVGSQRVVQAESSPPRSKQIEVLNSLPLRVKSYLHIGKGLDGGPRDTDNLERSPPGHR